ncbi:MAG: hypothetical protein ACLTD5_06865 [Eubacterium sp.]
MVVTSHEYISISNGNVHFYFPQNVHLNSIIYISVKLICSSREEHEALFGDAGDFEDDANDDFETDAMLAGLDADELEFMDSDERAEALEEAGLEADDYDFD